MLYVHTVLFQFFSFNILEIFTTFLYPILLNCSIKFHCKVTLICLIYLHIFLLIYICVLGKMPHMIIFLCKWGHATLLFYWLFYFMIYFGYCFTSAGTELPFCDKSFYFLEQFQVHSKIERQAQRLLMCPQPCTHTVSSTQVLHLLIADKPTLIKHHHPKFTVQGSLLHSSF